MGKPILLVVRLYALGKCQNFKLYTVSNEHPMHICQYWHYTSPVPFIDSVYNISYQLKQWDIFQG